LNLRLISDKLYAVSFINNLRGKRMVENFINTLIVIVVLYSYGMVYFRAISFVAATLNILSFIALIFAGKYLAEKCYQEAA